jgi:hypothetical protein
LLWKIPKIIQAKKKIAGLHFHALKYKMLKGWMASVKQILNTVFNLEEAPVLIQAIPIFGP